MAHLTAGGDPGGPRHDARVGHAPAVRLALPAPERGVARPRPAPRVVRVRVRSAPLVEVLEVVLQGLLCSVEEHCLVERAVLATLGAGAVVGHHHDDRVVEFAQLLDEIDHAPEVVIGLLDEPGVHLHLPGVHPLRVVGQRVPRGHVGVAFGQLGVLFDDAERSLAFEHDTPVLVPAAVEAAPVLVAPFGLDLVGRVAGAGRVVEEERLVRCVDVGVLDELDRTVGEVDVEVVALVGRRRRADRMVVVGEVGKPLVGRAGHEPVEPLEAAPERPPVERPSRGRLGRRGEVPLADGERVVAVLEQHLGQEAVLVADETVVSGESERGLGDRRQPDRVMVAPGQQRATRRRAQRGRMEVRVAQPAVGEAVERRRLAQPAVGGELPEAHVVPQHHDHVRRAGGGTLRGGPRGRGLVERASDHAGKRVGGVVLDDVVRACHRACVPQRHTAPGLM